MGVPLVQGSFASLEYWAIMKGGEGRKRKLALAGCVMLRFRKDGKCVEHRDYWVMGPGHKSPPGGWGFQKD